MRHITKRNQDGDYIYRGHTIVKLDNSWSIFNFFDSISRDNMQVFRLKDAKEEVGTKLYNN